MLREMEPKARPQDPDRAKLKRAILSAFAKREEDKNYIEFVCRELQIQRVKMPQRWLTAWGKNDFRVEQTNWFDACQKRKAKARIQDYVSKICHPKQRKSN